MMALLILADALTTPDFAPMHNAVEKCDREAMASLNKAEPHRRAEFAGAVYAEQRAIAEERAALGAPPAASGGNGNANGNGSSSPAGKASLEAARAALDARQRRLDDARTVEKAWREAVEELRADFLVNCDPRKRN